MTGALIGAALWISASVGFLLGAWWKASAAARNAPPPSAWDLSRCPYCDTARRCLPGGRCSVCYALPPDDLWRERVRACWGDDAADAILGDRRQG